MSETKETLGSFLRAEREKRGITIEQVASQTKIALKILHALENDHFNDLPAKPFIRGFVTSYCRFLEWDPGEVLLRFDGFIEQEMGKKPSKATAFSGYAFEKTDQEKSRLMLWVFIGVFVVMGGAFFAIFKPKLKHHSKTTDAIESLRETHEGGAVSTSPASPSPSVVLSSGSSKDANEHLAQLNAALSPTPSALPSPSPSPKASPSVLPNPSPSPSVKPSSSPSPSPSVKPSPSPSAKPSPSPSVKAEASPVPSASPVNPNLPNPKDPLNSGANLLARAIRHKVILKASDGVTVRYQTDGRPVTKLRVGKDKMLVLKGQDSLWFQVASPETVKVSVNGATYVSLEEYKAEHPEIQGTKTWFFPTQVPETIKNSVNSLPAFGAAPFLTLPGAGPSSTPTQ